MSPASLASIGIGIVPGTTVTLKELIEATTWPEIKAAIIWLDPEYGKQIRDYQKVISKLRKTSAVPDGMRISIELRSAFGTDEDASLEVVGRNGTLNRELDDFPFLGHQTATNEYGAIEAIYSLCLNSWNSWLGMQIDPETLRQYTPAQIIAYCVDEMTFHGFDESDVSEFSAELKRRVAEIDAMSPEERELKLIPAEKVFADLMEKYADEK